MSDPFVIFWAVLICASIAWYGFLVFYLGAKAGREILEITRTRGDKKARPVDKHD